MCRRAGGGAQCKDASKCVCARKTKQFCCYTDKDGVKLGYSGGEAVNFEWLLCTIGFAFDQLHFSWQFHTSAQVDFAE